MSIAAEGCPGAARRARACKDPGFSPACDPTKLVQCVGGDECLFDRLLCVRDEKRTAREERNAQKPTLARDRNDDTADPFQLRRASIVLTGMRANRPNLRRISLNWQPRCRPGTGSLVVRGKELPSRSWPDLPRPSTAPPPRCPMSVNGPKTDTPTHTAPQATYRPSRLPVEYESSVMFCSGRFSTCGSS
jgi:hypothetical protein